LSQEGSWGRLGLGSTQMKRKSPFQGVLDSSVINALDHWHLLL